MSFTKKPMNPMMANPIRVARAIFWNSAITKKGNKPYRVQTNTTTTKTTTNYATNSDKLNALSAKLFNAHLSNLAWYTY